ncbi:MAG: hypothetical protein UV37_C0008G0004 [Candidatus Collierbacteria bacterium GW2011_GWA1_42_60]|uniref:Uncharacterized protein n=1 Tax=Candidatus Collierbacteria bacterium GW2011_GWA2_42_17 TaxID=1618378 RepID=A0A0G0Z3U5_9BACT|nr:MAG: hypothetical protein UU94_C0001G0088 [Candidatus Collierbacteria bacterium GW2011_GWB2_42_12]KKS43412.1 MAG: hypothetical protein UV06_C0001G0146 [Candidatus Collierbacteria bacterium GW2011_GWA2_42_17]KKS62897.1 MAG: hypothetical protein UV30_C0009G0023 [Candidatus Collierbacteria bacterium GW2011_GWF1_42_50]KKS67339.1 MAG: hypothetical protein UV37_C0008G0004 [Candidatus Collierbacteria bacterium GW2011_GWA1_42_60]HAI22665.1 hypothetical protein [Candidatus Collierbacteria bacterium]
MPLLFVILSLFCLLLTKKRMTSDLSHLVHRLGGSQHSVIIVWSTIFLPGTLIHEISHFLVAALTGARTGKIEIFPEYLEDKLDEKSTHVALGSVQTQKLNPIQGFLVGIAPFISGMALLIWFASLFQTSFTAKDIWLLLLEGYLFFTVANSFFPSWSDIKQALPFVIISLVVTLLAWYFGFQIFLNSNSYIWTILNSLWQAIGISVLINLSLIGVLFILNLNIKRK